jgi:hypothetical protein
VGGAIVRGGPRPLPWTRVWETWVCDGSRPTLPRKELRAERVPAVPAQGQGASGYRENGDALYEAVRARAAGDTFGSREEPD